MRLATVTAILLAALSASPAAWADPAQAAGDYRTCAPEVSEQGRAVVRDACGLLAVPDFNGVEFQSAADVGAALAMRDSFLMAVRGYGRCVSDFITAGQQPGVAADGNALDTAACAHSWAEAEATDVVRAFGKACIDYANRSVMDMRLPPFSGRCYPGAEDGEG